MDEYKNSKIRIHMSIAFGIDLFYMREGDTCFQICYELLCITNNYKKYLLLLYNYTFKRYCTEIND